MKVIYTAGPYRGPNTWAIEKNIRAAEDVAAQVWAAGHIALCPHANARHMEGVTSDEVMLAGTLELMRRCDAVLLLPTWRRSTGAVAEVQEALRLRMPVMMAWADERYTRRILDRFGSTPDGFRVPPSHPQEGIMDMDSYWAG